MSKEALVVIDDNFISQLRRNGDNAFRDAYKIFSSVLSEEVDQVYVLLVALVRQKVLRLQAMESHLSETESTLAKQMTKLSDKSLRELVTVYTEAMQRYAEETIELRKLLYELTSRLNNTSSQLGEILSDESQPLPVRYYSQFVVPPPTRKSPQAAAFDVYCPTTTVLEPGRVGKVNTGLIIESPKGYHYEVRIRSSLAAAGIIMPTGVSIIDEDYRGPSDFLYLLLYNTNPDPYKIEAQSRLAQITFHRNCPAVDFLPQKEPEFSQSISRGGLGSTGK